MVSNLKVGPRVCWDFMHNLCQFNWKQTRYLIKIKAGGVGLCDPLPPLVTLTAPDTRWALGWLQRSFPGPSVWRSCASSPPVEQRGNRIRNSAPRVFVWRGDRGWVNVSWSVYISVFSVHHDPTPSFAVRLNHFYRMNQHFCAFIFTTVVVKHQKH